VKGKNTGKLASGLVKITDLPGFHVRAIDYEVTGRGDGDELITVITTITGPADVPAIDVAAAYHERWESERGKPDCCHKRVRSSSSWLPSVSELVLAS
jgi:hypothetical protein